MKEKEIIRNGNSFYCKIPFISYDSKRNTLILDGEFTPEDLKAIILMIEFTPDTPVDELEMSSDLHSLRTYPLSGEIKLINGAKKAW